MTFDVLADFDINTFWCYNGDIPFEEMLPPLVPSFSFFAWLISFCLTFILSCNFLLPAMMMTLMIMMDWMMTVMTIMDWMMEMMRTGRMMTSMSTHRYFHLQLEKQSFV